MAVFTTRCSLVVAAARHGGLAQDLTASSLFAATANPWQQRLCHRPVISVHFFFSSFSLLTPITSKIRSPFPATVNLRSTLSFANPAEQQRTQRLLLSDLLHQRSELLRFPATAVNCPSLFRGHISDLSAPAILPTKLAMHSATISSLRSSSGTLFDLRVDSDDSNNNNNE